MVTAERKLVRIDFIKHLKEEGYSAEQIVEKCNSLKARCKNPPPPKGSIGISAASRKYDVPKPTISRWVDRELIPILNETPHHKYIDEAKLAKVVEKYRENPGQGKQTLRVKKEKPEL